MNVNKIVLSLCLILISSIFGIAQDTKSNTTLLKNLTIIDVLTGTSIENSSLLIRDDKIQRILPATSNETFLDANVIDMTGHYAIPGLIDGHMHLFANREREKALNQLLLSGVTSVRDMGGDARVYKVLNDKIIEGTLRAPDIYYSATFFGPEFLQDPRTKFANQGIAPGEAAWMRVITEDTDLQAVVSEAKKTGATGIKVYASINPELLKNIASEAHKQGMKVWSHAAVFPSKPADAVNAKVDVLSHAVGMIAETADVLPNSFASALREFIPKQDFENADPASEEYLNLFQKMVSENVLFEPTLSAWQKPATIQKEKPKNSPKSLPAHKLMTDARPKLNIPAMNKWSKGITNVAYSQGVLICAGTDSTQQLKWIQDEIAFLVAAGLPEIDAIKAATINNAIAIGNDTTHGSISEGKQADLVILSENPLNDIRNVRSVKLVFKDGIQFSPKN